MKRSLTDLAARYQEELTERVLPFWLKHSLDHEAGGYFTCLDRRGRVYDTDKFIWLQARQVWLFSMLYNQLERRPEWLAAAAHGVQFLREHGRNNRGHWYFSLDRGGQPLVQPYNIFSDCFAAMAFAQYHLASGDREAAVIARKTFANILRRRANPKGQYNKLVPGIRPLQSFALPMILVNLSFELEGVVAAELLEQTAADCLREVFEHFLDRQRQLIYEHVLPDGSHADCFEGRLLNPGHGLEAMWFAMDYARRHPDPQLVNTAVDTTLSILDYSWDRKHGGIFYFLDAEGRPPQQLEWDQKLWWVHCETLIALLMGYSLTGRPELWKWFRKVHDYTWAHYPDPRYGEWFGYLNRQGEVLLPLKGGKWKGCFHVPRALFRCARELTALNQ